LGYPNIKGIENDENKIQVLSLKDLILNKEYIDVLEKFIYGLKVYNK